MTHFSAANIIFMYIPWTKARLPSGYVYVSQRLFVYGRQKFKFKRAFTHNIIPIHEWYT